MSRRVALIFAASLSLLGCAEPDRGPDLTARGVFELLASNPLSAGLERVYENLSAASRAELDRRAAAIREGRPGAREVKPWDLLAFERFTAGDRVSEVTVDEVTDVEARVTVKFDWYVDAADGGRRQQPEPVSVRLVREDGKWRVDLPLGPAGRAPPRPVAP